VRQNPDRLEAMLDRLEREAGRLVVLVGEILTLARLESGVSGARAERFDAMALLEAIADDARFEAETGGCRLDYRGSGNAPIDGQADLLGRALENVIRNAIRHTAEGTAVEVEGQLEDGRLCVLVQDCGPGVPDDELETIFEPFYRGRQGNGAGGFGLGLAIARRAVLAHGGSIRARNREGGGLAMAIDLPLA
jgi:two-component system OmpR family sensor kinase